VDVGAAYGGWSFECQDIFPNARYLLIEPLSEYSYRPQSVRSSIPGAIEIEAAATGEPGTISINVHDDLVGSWQGSVRPRVLPVRRVALKVVS
jgi:hypothetical protein